MSSKITITVFNMTINGHKMTLKVHDIVANGYGLMEQAHSVTVFVYVWCMLCQKRIHFTSHTRGWY